MANPTQITAPVTPLFGIEQLGKMRAAVTQQGVKPYVEWTMVDDKGDFLDLSAFNNASYKPVLAVREALQPQSTVIYAMDGSFVDAAVSVDATNGANTFLSYYTWGAGVGLWRRSGLVGRGVSEAESQLE